MFAVGRPFNYLSILIGWSVKSWCIYSDKSLIRSAVFYASGTLALQTLIGKLSFKGSVPVIKSLKLSPTTFNPILCSVACLASILNGNYFKASIKGSPH